MGAALEAGEQDTVQCNTLVMMSSQAVSTTLKKDNLFYVHNELDKEMAASMLKVSLPLTLLTEG